MLQMLKSLRLIRFKLNTPSSVKAHSTVKNIARLRVRVTRFKISAAKYILLFRSKRQQHISLGYRVKCHSLEASTSWNVSKCSSLQFLHVISTYPLYKTIHTLFYARKAVLYSFERIDRYQITKIQ